MPNVAAPAIARTPRWRWDRLDLNPNVIEIREASNSAMLVSMLPPGTPQHVAQEIVDHHNQALAAAELIPASTLRAKLMRRGEGHTHRCSACPWFTDAGRQKFGSTPHLRWRWHVKLHHDQLPNPPEGCNAGACDGLPIDTRVG